MLHRLPALCCCRAAWTLVTDELDAAGSKAGAGWSCGKEEEKDEEQHLNPINPVVFLFSSSYSFGQLEGAAKKEHHELWE